MKREVVIFFASILLCQTKTHAGELDSLLHQNQNRTEIDESTTSETHKSYWIGGTLAYNIQGLSTDYVIGAANIQLTEFDFPSATRFSMSVIGNLSNLSDLSPDTLSRKLDNIIQSNQGLSIGLMPMYNLKIGNVEDLRLYGRLSCKINAFKDAKDETNNLIQGRLSLGFEWEQLKTKGGAPLHLSAEGVFTAFDASIYNQIFRQKRNYLLGTEMNLILPISNTLGFLVKANYVYQGRPLYQIGIVIGKS